MRSICDRWVRTFAEHRWAKVPATCSIRRCVSRHYNHHSSARSTPGSDTVRTTDDENAS